MLPWICMAAGGSAPSCNSICTGAGKTCNAASIRSVTLESSCATQNTVLTGYGLSGSGCSQCGPADSTKTYCFPGRAGGQQCTITHHLPLGGSTVLLCRAQARTRRSALVPDDRVWLGMGGGWEVSRSDPACWPLRAFRWHAAGRGSCWFRVVGSGSASVCLSTCTCTCTCTSTYMCMYQIVRLSVLGRAFLCLSVCQSPRRVVSGLGRAFLYRSPKDKIRHRAVCLSPVRGDRQGSARRHANADRLAATIAHRDRGGARAGRLDRRPDTQLRLP